MTVVPKRPKVSVCVIAYNHERYIRQCLQSIVEQEADFEFEVIVGDDCSTDATAEIIAEFALQHAEVVHPVFHPKNVGASKNIRSVHGVARGEYVAHLDGDDYWLPGKLSSQVSFMERNRQCVASYTNAIVVSESGGKLGYFNGVIPSVFDINFLLARGNFLNFSSLLYRAGALAGLLSGQTQFLDYQVHLTLAKRHMLGFVNQNLVVYRTNSVTSIIRKDSNRVRELYWDALRQVNGDVRKVSILGATSRFLRDLIFHEIRHRKFRRLAKWISQIENSSPVGLGLILPVTLGLSILGLARYTLALIHSKAGSTTTERIFFPRSLF